MTLVVTHCLNSLRNKDLDEIGCSIDAQDKLITTEQLDEEDQEEEDEQ